MKDFNDFISTLDEETINGIIDDANQKAENVRQNTKNGGNMLGNQIGAISLTIALELIGCYHKWIHDGTFL